MNIKRQTFGTTPDSQKADLFTLTNEHDMLVTITNYGGTVTSLRVPDRDGQSGDVVLGYRTLEEYVRNPRYLGCIVGRHANRLAHGRFSLNGIQFQLAQNNGPNHLHGGLKGFDKKIWTAEVVTADATDQLRLSYTSDDGEEGYPGRLSVTVGYSVSNQNELRIDYRATSDRDTIVNLTNHSYFNLACTGDVLDHEVKLNADSFTPVSSDLIPTGEIRNVKDTPFDFRSGKKIRPGLNDTDEQLGFTGGYDHNFVLNECDGSLRWCATVKESTSGRVLEVSTTGPGIQFYSGNFLDGTLIGRDGLAYGKHAGLCLETQHFPDSPNHPNFPQTVLRARDEYRHITVFRFSTD